VPGAQSAAEIDPDIALDTPCRSAGFRRCVNHLRMLPDTQGSAAPVTKCKWRQTVRVAADEPLADLGSLQERLGDKFSVSRSIRIKNRVSTDRTELEMRTTTTEYRTASPRPCIPLPWNVFYEFAHMILVACVVTFGPHPQQARKQSHELDRAPSRAKLVHI
jgi:hypothetical protein